MAAGKLQEILPGRPITYRGQLIVNFLTLGGAIACAVGLIINPQLTFLFPLLIILSLAFGVMLIIPIGGADMPTVIALLNSYAGLSAVAMGFVLDNTLLIIAGALDGSSGLILSIIMCKAMNRSFSNVLFGAFGSVQADTGGKEGGGGGGDHGAGRYGCDRSRIRHGRGSGPTPGARALRSTDQARHQGEVRHSSGGRPHAGAYERAAG
jgi:NAD/NADP transhydrogenase beta subunit